MKNIFILLAFTIVLASCKTEVKNDTVKKVMEKKANYPKAISKVLEKHGGIEAWEKAKTVSYKIKKETHTVDLHSRKTLVAAENYALGFDGKEVWLTQQDTTAFTRDSKFYYNLFFYFYAMPFVLADNGIVYSEVEPLVYEGVSYPGIKIGYESNIGTSPDDNYFIYYNAETFQMEWLGYTVTYSSKKPSEKVKMIRYNNWEDVNGFLLPKAITWYKKDKESGVLKASEKAVSFSSAMVTETSKKEGFYANKNK